jgi:hypothetical protein
VKICSKCNLLQEENYFYKKHYACKSCMIKANSQYREDHKDKVKAYNKEYQKEYEARAEVKARRKQSRLKNKAHINERARKRYAGHKEEKKEYALKNRDRINECAKKRRANRPFVKLRAMVSIAVCTALKETNSSKRGASILHYLPFSIKELKDHLEVKFTEVGNEWMNWSNQGRYSLNEWNDNDPSTWKWQLDHIVPQSKYAYSSMEDENFKKCWALENLRPLSAKQNMIDGNRR